MAQFAEPIFSAAGLDPSAVHIYLLQDSRINAFVAGGQNLFLHTGLLRAAEHADQVIGVIAHETGHIAGGHLPRLKEAQRIASLEQLLFCTLGVLTTAGGAASGSNSAGGAIALCGANAPMGSLMKFSRTQESAADQAGMKYLDETGQSSRGMLEFLGNSRGPTEDRPAAAALPAEPSSDRRSYGRGARACRTIAAQQRAAQGRL